MTTAQEILAKIKESKRKENEKLEIEREYTTIKGNRIDIVIQNNDFVIDDSFNVEFDKITFKEL